MKIYEKFEYIKNNINNCNENGNIIFLEDEIDFVLKRTYDELVVVYESLGVNEDD